MTKPASKFSILSGQQRGAGRSSRMENLLGDWKVTIDVIWNFCHAVKDVYSITNKNSNEI